MSGRTDNEMGQIQKGLEDFLERELQLYTIEEEDKQEKELDIIGATGSGRNSRSSGDGKSGGNSRNGGSGGNDGKNRRSTASRRPSGEKYQFYEEDWDSEPVRNAAAGNARGSRSASRSGSRRTGGAGRKNGGSGSAGRYAERRDADDRESRRTRDQSSGQKSQNSRRPRKEEKSRPKKKWKSRLKRFLLAAMVILVLLGIGLYQLVGVVYHKMHYSEIPGLADEPMQEDGVVNILLIGNDSRENGEDGRSDAMILLSISRKTKTIYMTSLLRDMYVEIPGHNGNRLNAAYSFGGAELLMETVEQNFDITVNRYIQVNFEAFASLVDAVDGVDLELTSQEIEYVNGYLVEYNILTNRPQGTDNMDTSVSGMVHLNGPQALAYCRNRYLGTDFGRTERQRKVLAEVIHKLPGAVVTNAGELVDGLMPNLTTNLTQGECFRLSLMAGKLLTYDIISDSIPQPGTYKNATIRQMAVLEVDFGANKKFLREKIYGEEP